MIEEVLLFINQAISVSFINLLVFLYFKRIYIPKYSGKWIYVLAYTITTILYIVVNFISKSYNLVIFNTIFLFIHVNLSCVLLYECNIKKSFMYNSLYLIILVFADVFMVAFWSLLSFEGIKDTLNDIQYTFISHATTMLVTFFAWQVYSSILAKSELAIIKYKQTLLVGVFTIFATFVEYNFAIKINESKDVIITIIILIGFLFLNLYIVKYNEDMAQAYKSKNEYDLIKNQNELQLVHYKEMNRKYEEARIIIHDIKKHLDVMNSLNYTRDERVKEYSTVITKQVDSLFGGFQCTNRILSIIMSQKILVAESKNIKIITNIEDVNMDFIDDIHITAIFANLWDNSIEACDKVEFKNRFINVIVGEVDSYIVICFENSFNGIIYSKERKLLSTKGNHEGIGIEIIKSSAEIYGGVISTDISNNVFKSKVIIPLKSS